MQGSWGLDELPRTAQLHLQLEGRQLQLALELRQLEREWRHLR